MFLYLVDIINVKIVCLTLVMENAHSHHSAHNYRICLSYTVPLNLCNYTHYAKYYSKILLC